VSAWVWLLRTGRTLPHNRRCLFGIGLAASTIAYISSSFLPNLRSQAPFIDYVAVFAVLSSFAGFGAGWAGRGYGRLAACTASLLIPVGVCISLFGSL
jgi:cytochrome bd-type quinol oxidase subunit 1